MRAAEHPQTFAQQQIAAWRTTRQGRRAINVRCAKRAHTRGRRAENGPYWIRTSDRRIKSPLLYRLS